MGDTKSDSGEISESGKKSTSKNLPPHQRMKARRITWTHPKRAKEKFTDKFPHLLEANTWSAMTTVVLISPLLPQKVLLSTLPLRLLPMIKKSTANTTTSPLKQLACGGYGS